MHPSPTTPASSCIARVSPVRGPRTSSSRCTEQHLGRTNMIPNHRMPAGRRALLALTCAAALAPGDLLAFKQSAAGAATAPAPQTSTIPADLLDSLVAPIALYPDPLLAQTLAAST